MYFYTIKNASRDLVAAYLNNKQRCNVSNNFSSISANNLFGIHKGTVFGPFFASLNMICPNMLNCPFFSFLTTVSDIARSKLVEISISLQQDLDATHRWEQKLLIVFTTGKAFPFNISRKRNRSCNTNDVLNTILGTIESTANPGVKISHNLTRSP